MRITHWINGKPSGAPTDRTAKVYDPATGVVSGLVDLASTEIVDRSRTA